MTLDRHWLQAQGWAREPGGAAPAGCPPPPGSPQSPWSSHRGGAAARAGRNWRRGRPCGPGSRVWLVIVPQQAAVLQWPLHHWAVGAATPSPTRRPSGARPARPAAGIPHVRLPRGCGHRPSQWPQPAQTSCLSGARALSWVARAEAQGSQAGSPGGCGAPPGPSCPRGASPEALSFSDSTPGCVLTARPTLTLLPPSQGPWRGRLGPAR